LYVLLFELYRTLKKFYLYPNNNTEQSWVGGHLEPKRMNRKKYRPAGLSTEPGEEEGVLHRRDEAAGAVAGEEVCPQGSLLLIQTMLRLYSPVLVEW